MRKIFYLTISLLILGVLSEDPIKCEDQKAPGDDKKKCNSTVVTNNLTSSCCFVKTNETTRNYCHELEWNLTKISEYQKDIQKGYPDNVKIEVLCNAKFLSFGLYLAAILLIL